MTERYEPKSDFLRNFDPDIVPLTGHAFGRANLGRLIKLMSDPDRSNRDWATFHLASSDICDDEAIDALIDRTQEEDTDTRAEAILGLARRNHPKATELLKVKLAEQTIGLLDIEAAGCLADRTLLPVLRDLLATWDNESDDEHVSLIKRAILACESGDPDDGMFCLVEN